MKSSKSQEPSSREIPIAEHQTRTAVRYLSLKFGASLRFGGWCLVLCLPAFTQPFEINWSTIDGGGGTSTGGVYSVSGTLGQPDAGGPMTNGQYSVTGGFWVLPTAIQTPGAPTLTIAAASPGHATISWMPDTGTNWVLQQTAVLSPANWTNSPSGWTNPIVVPVPLLTKFYRLFKP